MLLSSSVSCHGYMVTAIPPNKLKAKRFIDNYSIKGNVGSYVVTGSDL